MKTILRDNEPEDLAEGRRLIQEEMEKERALAKGKNKVDEGSSSAVEPKSSGVEEYHPDDPLIPLGLTPVVVGAPAASLDGGSVEGISLFSPQFVKAIVNCHRLVEQPIELVTCVPHNTGGEPVDKDVEKRTEAEKIVVSPSAGVDILKQAEGTTAEKGVLAPSADAPKDDETIEALKDMDGRHVEDEEDIISTKEAEDDDDETLADRKARQEKEMALKKVG